MIRATGAMIAETFARGVDHVIITLKTETFATVQIHSAVTEAGLSVRYTADFGTLVVLK